MDDVNNWLEQECLEFERRFFSPGKLWRSPVQALKGTELYGLFESFARFFPDHPSEINTVFYLTESVEGTRERHSVWLWCSHFEPAALEDLRNLVSFVDEASRLVSTSLDSAGVEVLDNIKEQLVLVFYTPRESMVDLLKGLGVQAGVV